MLRKISSLFWLLILSLTLVLVWPVQAADAVAIDEVEIDAFIRDEMRSARIPGLSIVITQDGEVVYLKSFGSDGRGAPMTPQTPLYLGSLSKSFTAAAVMQLVDAGEVGLDEPVTTYIPGFEVAQPGFSDGITVRNLLNQTSGLSSLEFDESSVPANTLADRVDSLSTAIPNAEPGERFQYFNPNYSVLGLLIEQVSGMTYGEYMREHIFTPLEMRSTTAYAAEAPNLAQGHTIFLGFPQDMDQPYLLSEAPAGFLISTVEDLAHYLIALADSGRYNGEQIITPDGVNLLQTPPDEIDSPYAMGWFQEEQDGQTIIYHTGDLPAFHAFAAFLPKENIQVAFLINQNGLIPSSVTFPRLRFGLINLLSGMQPSGGVTSNTLYFFLMIVIAVSLANDVRRFILVPAWARAVADMPRRKVFFDIAWEFIIPIILLILIPLVLQSISGRSFTWNLAYQFMPDVIIWLLTGIALSLARGIRKILAYRSQNSLVDQPV